MVFVIQLLHQTILIMVTEHECINRHETQETWPHNGWSMVTTWPIRELPLEPSDAEACHMHGR